MLNFIWRCETNYMIFSLNSTSVYWFCCSHSFNQHLMDLLIVKITEVCFFFWWVNFKCWLELFFASFQLIYVEEPIIRRLYTIIIVLCFSCRSTIKNFPCQILKKEVTKTYQFKIRFVTSFVWFIIFKADDLFFIIRDGIIQGWIQDFSQMGIHP